MSSGDACLRRRALDAAAERMQAVMSPNQVLGRSRPIGCTAVEITQRCNLDCTLCYLSERAEQVRDLPLEEVLRRLDEIRTRYGPGTPVQITGGEPTLRKRRELIAIVRHARAFGLSPALFTNGIAASRGLLAELAAAGLADVAFHVDTTQLRPGGGTERDLNAVRREYIERARGLGLTVAFNTTVHAGNLEELPALLGFFAIHAAVVGLAAFQLQAATGRGEWGRRAENVSMATVQERLETGAGTTLPWNVIRVGHPDCHKYVPTLAVNGRLFPVIEDQKLFAEFLRAFAGVGKDRFSPRGELLRAYARHALRRPRWIARGAGFALRHAWHARRALLAARGRVDKLSIVVHDFMDADCLDPARVDACSFMVMTAGGPVSMCAHNARRDEHILAPMQIRRADGTVVQFYPLRPSTKRPERRGVTLAKA